MTTACLPIIGYSWLADCPEQHYTLGWICCDITPPVVDEGLRPGGGSRRSRTQVPGVTSNRALAMREDEEIVAVLQAFLASRRKH